MKALSDTLLSRLWQDWDTREELIREVVQDRLRTHPPPRADDHLIASYFFALRTTTLEHIGKEIVYHSTSGTKDLPPGSLLEQCTGRCLGTDAFDGSGRLGLVHMAFPLKMLLQEDGHLTSTDILHTVAGAIVFDVYENLDARLVQIDIPPSVIRTFPGPAYGPEGLRKRTGFSPSEPAFGTILKPTAGITPDDVERLVEEAADCPLFLFVKEDENLYPRLSYSPVEERTRRALAAIRRAADRRKGRGLLFAPHITGTPHEIAETIQAVVECGAEAVMFSESFAIGAVRLVREATRHLPNPPAIYGHNAGIGVRTRAIWREVIDLLARLDGIDFRQTAPVKPGKAFLKPYGAEWEASESVLTRPIDGIRPTMIARAGALDQGNIGLNLEDAARRGLEDKILFLSGSAINSIRGSSGKPDPKLGAQAMTEALEVHRSGELRGVPAEEHLQALAALAQRRGLAALLTALQQRYPGKVA
jgi:ribulose 1,5-bisphosphate carboxylase large subunit-like protein